MFDFFINYENRRAFKKALEELEEENSLTNAKQTQNVEVARSYKSAVGEEKVTGTLKVFNPLRKPETEAVDLKNFKNWREDKNSSTAINKPARRAFDIEDDEEDEGVSLEIESPLKTRKMPQPQTFNIIDIMNSSTNKTTPNNKEISASSFFMEKYGLDKKEEKIESQPKLEIKEKTPIVEDKPVHKKTTLNALLKSKMDKLFEDETKPEIKDIKEQDKVKIEVVDFKEKKLVQKTKKTTRKPRGKSKKRFDADVISSVDWK